MCFLVSGRARVTLDSKLATDHELTSDTAVFLVAFPLRRLADFHGKKKIISLALIGLILSSVWVVMIGHSTLSLSLLQALD